MTDGVFWVLGNHSRREVGELGSKNPDCECVKIPPCLSLRCLSRNLLASWGNPTHKCVLLGQGTKALYRQSKKTKVGRSNGWSGPEWLRLGNFSVAWLMPRLQPKESFLCPSSPGALSHNEALFCLQPPASYFLPVPVLTCAWLVTTEMTTSHLTYSSSWPSVPVMPF